MDSKWVVHQEIIYRPLLFLIYMDDLANVCKFTLPVFFVADSNLFQDEKNLDDIECMLNKELNEVVGSVVYKCYH